MLATHFRRLTRYLALLALLGSTMGADSCLGKQSSTPDATPADAASANTYTYVLIEDLEDDTTVGVDLDAVALMHGGTTYYADEWHEYITGPGIDSSNNTDCSQALGPPDNAAGECTSGDSFFVNLGGLGGSVVVSFDGRRELNTGDEIRVWDCGPVPDEYRISVGVGSSVTDPNWVLCASVASGVSACTVPALP